MGTIRIILAITVIITHTDSLFGLQFVGGSIAVRAFYLISGFYMSLILNEKYIGKNNSYFLFISNRFLKLFPIYWIVLLFTLLTSIIYYFYSNGTYFDLVKYYFNYYKILDVKTLLFITFSNIFIFFQDWISLIMFNLNNGNLYFSFNDYEAISRLGNFLFIPQAWTIGLEITFYLIAPFILRKKIWIILILIFFSIFLRIIFNIKGIEKDPWSYRFFPNEFVFFLLGYISFLIYKRIEHLKIKNKKLNIIFYFILIFTLFFNLIPIKKGLGYIYIFCFLICVPFIFKLSKKWNIDRYLGDLSYPIYISHYLVIVIYNDFFKIIKYNSETTLLIIIITIIFSIILNEFIAKKVEQYRQMRLIK